MSTIHQLQALINAFVGIVPGLKPIDVDGDIGAKTAEAASLVATYLYIAGVKGFEDANFGKVTKGFFGAVYVGISAADLRSNVTRFNNLVEGWMRAHNMEKAADAAKTPKTVYPSQPSRGESLPAVDAYVVKPPSLASRPAFWWVVGSVAIIGAGTLGFFYHKNR